MRLTEPTLRLTALHGWVTAHRHPFGAGLSVLHFATLSTADDARQGVAACGTDLDRAAEWWRATTQVTGHATQHGTVWDYCGPCLYWAGGPGGQQQ